LKPGIHADADGAAENASTGANQTNDKNISHIIVAGIVGMVSGLAGFVVGAWGCTAIIDAQLFV
jgi:hypothetical protein